jgi:tetratricopeptide (TPR) repeat protein
METSVATSSQGAGTLDPPSLLGQGLALHRAGRIAEAAQAYEQLLAAVPQHADALHLLSGIQLQLGRMSEALNSLTRLVAVRPSAGAHYNRALCLMALGQPVDALAAYGLAIDADPTLAPARVNRGVLLHQLGRPQEALVDFDAVLALAPQPAEVHHYRGLSLRAMRRLEEALASFERALALNPDFAEAHNSRGLCLFDLGRPPEEVLALFDGLVQRRRDYPEAWYNRGVALQSMRRLGAAAESYARAAALRPGYGEAHYNRGVALIELNRCGEALTALDLAVGINAEDPNLRYTRSLCLLKLGRLKEGFSEYRWRLRVPDHARSLPSLPFPEWAGEDLQGKSILVLSEQGFGDCLQFIRYVRFLIGKADRVTVETYPSLQKLFTSIPGLEVRSTFESEGYDYQIPLLTLPDLVGTTLETIPADTPYLFAPSQKVAHWAGRVGARPSTKVGLVWAGAPRVHNPAANAIDARRSLGLEQLGPLAAAPDVRFFSLQKGGPAAEASTAPAGLDLIDFTSELEDFDDTAALIQALDLVITVDTSVAHLAGALGKPVWILSRFDGCWRWLEERDDSPWYPSARLFHQKQEGDWDEVVARVASELADFARAER